MTFRLTTILLLLVSAGAPAFAAGAETQRWYEVELIVFAREGVQDEEIWPEHPELPELSEARELLPASGSPKPEAFRRLPADRYRLTDAENRLVRSGGLEPLLHIAWRQPGLSEDKAIPVHIRTEQPVASSQQAAEYSDGTGFGGDGLGATEPKPRLDGTVRLLLSRYLHLEVDLAYREDTDVEYVRGTGDGDDTESAEIDRILGIPQQQVYRMVDSRRMRSKEVHYLDHPKLGVIAVVTPYESPATKAAPVKASPKPAPGNSSTGVIRRQ